VPVYTRGVYLRYDSLREAAEAKDILQQHGFLIDYISGYEFAIAKTQDTAQLNEFEGQVKLPVVIEANPHDPMWSFTSVDLAEVTKAVELAAAVFGSVRNCIHVETSDSTMTIVFRIEFHSIDAAARAVQNLRTDPAWGFSNAVSILLPYLTALTPRRRRSSSPLASLLSGRVSVLSSLPTAPSLVSMTRVALSDTAWLMVLSLPDTTTATQLTSTTVSVVSAFSMAAMFALPSCCATFQTRWTG
jgi:hypothetical protein